MDSFHAIGLLPQKRLDNFMKAVKELFVERKNQLC